MIREFKKKKIELAGNKFFEAFVLNSKGFEKIMLVPTDQSWEYFHLTLMIHPKGRSATFQKLSGLISREELEGCFDFSHLD